MDEYVWWDPDASDEEEALGPLNADSWESALDQATWLFIGLIGEQHEYDLLISLKRLRDGEIRTWSVVVEFEPGPFQRTEVTNELATD